MPQGRALLGLATPCSDGPRPMLQPLTISLRRLITVAARAGDRAGDVARSQGERLGAGALLPQYRPCSAGDACAGATGQDVLFGVLLVWLQILAGGSHIELGARRQESRRSRSRISCVRA